MLSVTTAPFWDVHELFAHPCFKGSNALSHVLTREGAFYAHSLLRTFLFDGEENINMNCLKQSLSGEFQYPMYSPVGLLLLGHGNSGHLEGTNLHRSDRINWQTKPRGPEHRVLSGLKALQCVIDNGGATTHIKLMVSHSWYYHPQGFQGKTNIVLESVPFPPTPVTTPRRAVGVKCNT